MIDTIFIHKGNNVVSFYLNDDGFSGYSLRAALKIYRERHGLKYKRIDIIDMR